jgi:homoserine dehydrogenase
MQHIKIGLFGFGCVGQGLYETLNTSKNFAGEITRICVKSRKKNRALPANVFTYDKQDILNDDTIDIIVELIDDADAALHIVTAALKSGKSVVTANKKMVAENLEYLVELQKETGRALLYEGAVCGSIPIIRTLEEYFGHEPLKEVRGIFNGSTNYILTKVFEEKLDYQRALSQAQEQGFAETDPTLDVQGYDPKYKLSILLTHAFGIHVAPEKIVNLGINRLKPADLEFARDRGLGIKLLGQAVSIEEQVYAYVVPQFVNKGNNLSSIRNEFNAVTLNGDFCDDQLFIGKGAGSLPTGAAVLSDISALSYDYRYEYKKHYNQGRLHFTNDRLLNVYVSFGGPDDVVLEDFESVSSSFFCYDRCYVIGQISLERLQKPEWQRNDRISLIQLSNTDFDLSERQSIPGLEEEIKELKKGRKIREKLSV